MSKALIHTRFDFNDIVMIIKNSNNQSPLCRELTQHLCELVDVALLKLELLIKTNQQIDELVGKEYSDDDLPTLEQLCARSEELYSAIEHLPLMKENKDLLIELLPVAMIGDKLAELFYLLYFKAKDISNRRNPFVDMEHLHAK